MAVRGLRNLFDLGEIFCGAGGFGAGFKKARFRSRWGVDIDPDACATYELNVGEAICRPVEEVNFAKLPAVGGLAFGFPCNDFSLVGERRGTDGYYGKLYTHAVRALNECRPLWFVAENVPGLMSNGGDRILNAFAMAGRGYDVAVHQYRFDEYGVPQRRVRIVAVGIAKELGKAFRPPTPSSADRPISAGEALAGVEAVAANNERTRHPKRTIDLLSHIPEGQNAWHKDIPRRLQLNVKNCRLSLIYRRLHRDEPAYTVVAAGGGGTHMYHFDEPRALTNRERARLQSFDDDFEFVGSVTSVRKQIGMAVPPVGALAIAKALRATLEGKRYASVDPSFGRLGADVAELSLVS